jgi:Xaa-Pro aminopeptidase
MVMAPAKSKKPSTSRKIAAESPYCARIERLLALLESSNTDHILITHPLDVGYLTGFLGGESYLLLGPGRPLIISDSRYEEELEPQKTLADIFIRTKPINAAAAAILETRGLARCAVQAEHLTLSEFESLGKLCKHTRLIPTKGLVPSLRVRKDESEIALMKKATRIQEAALLATLPTIRAGQTELHIAAKLEAEMKSRGSSRPGFESIVAARANGSLPHYRPGPAKAAANQPLLIDWGAVYRGYQGDMTRTFTLGKWPKKIREIYQIVLDAQQLAAAALAPGKLTTDIDKIARDYISKHGYGEQFGHGLGHGLGMIKEPPYLHYMYDPIPLEVGHVCTVEPGIYLPGVGGVRIEDLYVIREQGAENLCSLPKTIDWATL